MRLDIKKLKTQLTLQDHEKIINSLDIPIIHKADNIWSLKSMCHSKTEDCGENLKLYTDSLTYTCFSHGCLNGSDIIALVQTRKMLFDKSFTFMDSVNYIIDTLDLSIEHLTRKTPKKETFNWDKFFGRYIRHESVYDDNEIYDESILNFFPKIYHQSFIDDNISIQTMQKYEVCYYPRNQQIVLPVRDENMQLIGLHSRNLIPDKIDIGLKYQPTKLLDNTEYNFSTSMVLYGLGQNKDNIIKTKRALIFESPKAVQQMEDILECNNSVGLFGMNMSKYKRQLLLNLGINSVDICLDKGYNIIGDDKYIEWQKRVNKIIDMFIGYVEVNVIYDRNGLLGYNDSPSDRGKEIWKTLEKEKEGVE